MNGKFMTYVFDLTGKPIRKIESTTSDRALKTYQREIWIWRDRPDFKVALYESGTMLKSNKPQEAP